MIALLDTSVVVRRLLHEPNPWTGWKLATESYASRLVLIELDRVLDRCRLAGKLDDEEVAKLHEDATELLRPVEILALSERILDRAAGPLPTVVGSLDAIHLATALELRLSLAAPVTLVTHDETLSRGARASGLTVLGV